MKRKFVVRIALDVEFEACYVTEDRVWEEACRVEEEIGRKLESEYKNIVDGVTILKSYPIGEVDEIVED